MVTFFCLAQEQIPDLHSLLVNQNEWLFYSYNYNSCGSQTDRGGSQDHPLYGERGPRPSVRGLNFSGRSPVFFLGSSPHVLWLVVCPSRSFPCFDLNGFVYSLRVRLSSMISSQSCSRIYFLIVSSFKLAVLTWYPMLQNLRLPYRYFSWDKLSKIIREQFVILYSYPHNLCTWSVIICPFLIFIPL